MSDISKELMGASSIPMILSILQNGDSYGYEIMQKLKEISNGKIIWKEGSLYPVLKKLEKSGLIKSYWNIKDYDRHRKYYKIASKGQKMLEKEKSDWELMQNIFEKLWKSTQPASI